MRRLVHTPDDLRDLAEAQNLPAELIEKDYVLVSIAAKLASDFPGQLCLKGGFVLRHVHGFTRMSRDVDGTRHSPPKHKLEAEAVADSIRGLKRFAGVSVNVPEPATDSARSLDFDGITYRGLIGSDVVSVEISYREALSLDPEPAWIGEPYYERFQVLVLAPAEIAAEKLRTLAQRLRPSDLSDLARLLGERDVVDDDLVRSIIPAKFAPGLVKPGDHAQRIRESIAAMAGDYETQMAGLDPEAPSYEDATRVVLGRLRRFFV